MMIRFLFPLCIILFSGIHLFAQDDDDYVDEDYFRYEDRVYKENIKAVRFHIRGAEMSMPMVDLGGGAQLVLDFDDLEADGKSYYYTIVHCNKDWTPSDGISDMEYIDGFTEEEIRNIEFSNITQQDYTHYRLFLPNNDMKFTKSGNYLLKVYTDEGEEDLAFTKRFVVVDTKIRIMSEVNRAYSLGQMHTHQELDFIIDHKGLVISNPKQEVSVSVLQNGNWMTAMQDIQPLFIRSERLEYDYQGKITFPGMKEYRLLDMRSMRHRGRKVADIYDMTDYYAVELEREQIRIDYPYLTEIDMNGNFIIDNLDDDDPDLDGDYAEVTFQLEKRFPFDNGHVYVFGGLTHWQLDEEFRMEFNEDEQAYMTTAYLKQGFYNYMYVYVPKGTEEISYEETEGNFHETENNYTIIVYYRPFGGRYDQVIGAQTLNSNN